jgi:hypothetical protein
MEMDLRKREEDADKLLKELAERERRIAEAEIRLSSHLIKKGN